MCATAIAVKIVPKVPQAAPISGCANQRDVARMIPERSSTTTARYILPHFRTTGARRTREKLPVTRRKLSMVHAPAIPSNAMNPSEEV